MKFNYLEKIMKLRNPANFTLAFLILITTLSGCAHQLQIKNLDTYHNTSIVGLETPLRVGIRATCNDITGQKIVHGVGGNLSKYNARATTAVTGDNSNVDVLATVSILSDYKGSGWNFLVNFPGFLVWAPAWHGYNYQLTHKVVVHLSDAKTGAQINSLDIPVVLNVRHADFNRTWTELSWFEWGVIAFVGGIAFIQYDESVTPLVEQRAGPVITDYIAQQIACSLEAYKPAVDGNSIVSVLSAGADSLESKLIKLNTLKEKGLLSEDEYQAKRNAVLDEI
jgi:hypothetical protein